MFPANFISGSNEDKKRHHNVARAVHWDLSKKCGFERRERWYDHVSDSALEN